MSRKILTVEDEPIIREMIELVLSGAGYVVAPAGSGRDALDMLSRNRFDLVLLGDILSDLPPVDNFELHERQRYATGPQRVTQVRVHACACVYVSQREQSHIQRMPAASGLPAAGRLL